MVKLPLMNCGEDEFDDSFTCVEVGDAVQFRADPPPQHEWENLTGGISSAWVSIKKENIGIVLGFAKRDQSYGTKTFCAFDCVVIFFSGIRKTIMTKPRALKKV